ncbi:hypothetical protein ACFPPF_21950 [Xenophilus aerolatus]|nr:hypothetical protein [Xenophilus aerolatus]
MWVFTPAGGFVSVVREREDAARGTVTIRPRVKQDLVDLRQFIASMDQIESGAGSDYEHRLVVAAADFEAGMAAMARAVTYSTTRMRFRG